MEAAHAYFLFECEGKVRERGQTQGDILVMCRCVNSTDSQCSSTLVVVVLWFWSKLNDLDRVTPCHRNVCKNADGALITKAPWGGKKIQ